LAKELQYTFKFVFKGCTFEISPINGKMRKLCPPQIGQTHNLAILGFFLEVSKKTLSESMVQWTNFDK
jgi:hypothetical protein